MSAITTGIAMSLMIFLINITSIWASIWEDSPLPRNQMTVLILRKCWGKLILLSIASGALTVLLLKI